MNEVEIPEYSIDDEGNREDQILGSELRDSLIRHRVESVCYYSGGRHDRYHLVEEIGSVLAQDAPMTDSRLIQHYQLVSPLAQRQKERKKDGADEHLINMMLANNAVKEPIQAPDFSLASIEGETIHFSDHVGKVIVVNFWKPG